jgi:hypothetical protein
LANDDCGRPSLRGQARLWLRDVVWREECRRKQAEVLSLHLADLILRGYLEKGCASSLKPIRWTDSISGQLIAFGYLSADLRDEAEGWLRAEISGADQKIRLISVKRHFGGRQWYFVCPATGEKATVLWKPPGAGRFCSRKAWGTQVAYLSQFGNWIDRAHAGKAKIKAKLLRDCDPEEWELPPKPKLMRLKTYIRLVKRFDAYQDQLDNGMRALAPHLFPDG